MKVKDLKRKLEAFNDENEVCVDIGLGTTHRINKGIIVPIDIEGNHFSIERIGFDIKTNTIVLSVE